MATSTKCGNGFRHRLLLVGNPETGHVGSHLVEAAADLGLEPHLLDARAAWSKNNWLNRVCWRFLARTPPRLGQFSREVIAACVRLRPGMLLVTGISAPSAAALRLICRTGIHSANYLTDDPWNRSNGANYFRRSLRAYDMVWSPRRANLEDLRMHGCPRVDYLPFGYNPKLHFPEPALNPAEIEPFKCDVLFFGGADSDRLPLARALAGEGFSLHLYGGYWDRDPDLRRFWKGMVHGRDLRLAVAGASVSLCIGRKANRDGHAMRSLELPAMAACIVAEDTPEHRDLLGDDGEGAVYYSSTADLIAAVRRLCSDAKQRTELRNRALIRITSGGRHTYSARLKRIWNANANANS